MRRWIVWGLLVLAPVAASSQTEEQKALTEQEIPVLVQTHEENKLRFYRDFHNQPVRAEGRFHQLTNEGPSGLSGWVLMVETGGHPVVCAMTERQAQSAIEFRRGHQVRLIGRIGGVETLPNQLLGQDHYVWLEGPTCKVQDVEKEQELARKEQELARIEQERLLLQQAEEEEKARERQQLEDYVFSGNPEEDGRFCGTLEFEHHRELCRKQAAEVSLKQREHSEQERLSIHEFSGNLLEDLAFCRELDAARAACLDRLVVHLKWRRSEERRDLEQLVGFPQDQDASEDSRRCRTLKTPRGRKACMQAFRKWREQQDREALEEHRMTGNRKIDLKFCKNLQTRRMRKRCKDTLPKE